MKQTYMKISFFSVALSVALSAATTASSAQKTYTHGVITYKTSMRGQDVEIKEYFTTDSTAVTFSAGPAIIKLLSDADHKFFVTVVDVSAFNVRKAAIYTPDEVNQAMADMPTLTFVAGNETKQISGFNCTKVVATDTKDNKTYDVWITNDIAVPPTAVPFYYQSIGGFPVQYFAFQQGQTAEITISTVSEEAGPEGIFSIPPGFDRITKDDLEAMSRSGQ